MCGDDGREDSTMLGNPWFWLIVLVCAGLWGVVIRAAFA